MIIASKDNPKYKLWLKLSQKKYRVKERLFLVEGEHLVIEAKKSGAVVDILICEGVTFDSDGPVTYLKKALFEKLASTVTSAGIMAVCRMQDEKMIANNRLLLVDGIQDPGNLGTLIRSALAFGFNGLIMSEDTVDVYNEKVVRATQGALFKLAMKRVNLVDYVTDLQKLGVVVYAATLNKDAKMLQDISPSCSMAFVVGNEGAGVSDTLAQICDGYIMIEMVEMVESLNVGVAGSILMHQFNGMNISR